MAWECGQAGSRPHGTHSLLVSDMRLFTGLDLPGEIVDRLEHLQRRLKPAARINWSPLANLHITTRFIGEWPETRLGELTAALGAIASREPIPVAIRRLGFYPNAQGDYLLGRVSKTG